MRNITFNINFDTKYNQVVKAIVSKYGRRCPSPAGLRYADTYSLTAPVKFLGNNTVAVGDDSFRAYLTDIFPDFYNFLVGQYPYTTQILPQHIDDGARFEQLINFTSTAFAKIVRECLPIQQNINIASDFINLTDEVIISHMLSNDSYTITIPFVTERIYPKDQVLGVDWGQRNFLPIAISDDITDVKHYALPIAARNWVAVADPSRRTNEWQVMRQLTAAVLRPALAYIIQHGAIVSSEHIKLPQMSQVFLQRMRLLGMIDIQRAYLPQPVYASGGQSIRVSPSNTSQICHICHKPGLRQGETLLCANHGPIDSDGNAAIWIRRGGVQPTLLVG